MTDERHFNYTLAKRVTDDYTERFGAAPAIVLRSPGRINLIGEHTDYNDGFVLPGAVSQGIYIALGPQTDCTHHWHAMDLGETVRIGADNLGSLRDDWSDFIHGAWLAMREEKSDIPWFNATFSADLPIGSGMSSSSALTCGILYALNALAGLSNTGKDIAAMAYTVEREFIGVRGGIMDQYSSVISEPGKLLLLDCKDRTSKLVSMPEGLRLFLIHTKVQRSLKASGYNQRSDECARALEQLKAHSDIESFRDITLNEFQAQKDHIDPIPFKRIQYVYNENQRVMDMIEALKINDASLAGRLLYEGHIGLRDEFEVSIPELDLLVELTRDEDWIQGARMMGGGFGGCTINLATRKPDDKFVQKVTEAYRNAFEIEPAFITVNLTGGTAILDGLH